MKNKFFQARQKYKNILNNPDYFWSNFIIHHVVFICWIGLFNEDLSDNFQAWELSPIVKGAIYTGYAIGVLLAVGQPYFLYLHEISKKKGFIRLFFTLMFLDIAVSSYAKSNGFETWILTAQGVFISVFFLTLLQEYLFLGLVISAKELYPEFFKRVGLTNIRKHTNNNHLYDEFQDVIQAPAKPRYTNNNQNQRKQKVNTHGR